MSGLLDKAKDVAKDGGSTEDSIPAKDKGTGLLEKATVVDFSGGGASSAVGNIEKTGEGLTLYSIIGFAGGLFFLAIGFYMVGDVMEWGGYLVLGILIISWGLNSWGFKEFKGDWNTKRMVALGMATLLVSGIPYMATFSFPSNVSIGEIEIDESKDSLSFTIFNTIGDDATASVEADGIEVWSKTGISPGSNDQVRVDAPLSDVYQGSTIDAFGEGLVAYTIKVSVGDKTSEVDVNALLLDRTVKNAGADMIPVTEQQTTSTPDDNEHQELNHLGLQMTMAFGVMNSGEDRGDSSEGKWQAFLRGVESDFNFNVAIKNEGSTVWTGTTYTVDGDSMSSTQGDSGHLDYGWLPFVVQGMEKSQNMHGEDVWYLPRDDFYDEDGCYTIEITVTHLVETDDMVDPFTHENGFHYYWNENENRDSDEDYKAAGPC